MPLIISRKSTCRGRPMDLACGTNGEMISHSASAISLGYAFRVIVEELQLLDLFLFSNDALDRFRPLYISLETASKTLVGAVKRIFEPGCQFDNVLIIKGKQGYFKTSLFRDLAGKDYFDTINLTYNKDDLMICHSKWILELGECEEDLKPYTMSKLKAFLTKQNDTYRKPYDKNPITVPRQFILVGTTNKDEFLVDETGNRRFWCIELNEKIDIEWVKQHRDLIWAAAVKAYRDNYPTYLNETEQQLSNARNIKYQQYDIWQTTIENWLFEQTEPFTLSDVLTNAIGKEPKFLGTKDKDRVINILLQLGCQKPAKTTRVNSKPGKYWTKLQVGVTN